MSAPAEQLTPAVAQLAKRQRKYPPLYNSVGGGDRALQLYQALAPALPHKIRELVDTGTVAIGEIGLYSPQIQTISIDADGAVVEFNSGMMDFIYAVIRTLSGSTVRVTTAGAQNDPALPLTEIARQTAALFRQWKWPRNWIWSIRRIRYPAFQITDSVHGWVERMAKNTELFLLAHELGHVSIDSALVPPSPEKTEVRADTIGCGFMFSLAMIGHVDLAEAFSAGILAIRICAGLEDMGVQFPRLYPPQAERLNILCKHMMSVCPSVQYFHEISRIGVAYEDQMDDVEDHFDKRPRAHPPNRERVLVRLIAELLDVAQGRLSSSQFAGHIMGLSEQTPADITRQAFHSLYDYYVSLPPSRSFIDPVMRDRMGRLLLQVVEGLPKQTQELFLN
jgi:hypothetical protein